MSIKDIYRLFLISSGVSTDTRNIHENCIFIALKGQNFNGNAFALESLQNGASYAIVDEKEYCLDPRIILVDDSLQLLQKLARYHRDQFNIPVIGITGSNGKTSTKELLATALASHFNVLFTLGNLNNHIGVPLTLLKLNAQHEIAIIEMGANKPGDITELCVIAAPNLGVITNIGKAHLEGFGDFNGVLQTKLGLYRSIEKNAGKLFYNGDDATLTQNLPQEIENFSYGKSEHNKLVGELIELNPKVKMKYHFEDYTSETMQMNMLGDYNFYNYLVAISFSLYFKIPKEKFEKALMSYESQNQRSQIKETQNNTVIFDCYNANPSSMESALRSFAAIANSSKFIIIGDMLELGKESEKEHRATIELCRELDLRGISIGLRFMKANNYDAIQSFDNKEEAFDFLSNTPIKNHLVLLKGSRGIGLETLESIL